MGEVSRENVVLLEEMIKDGGGKPESYRNLGIYYEKVCPCFTRAVKYYTMASDLGDRQAQWNLGVMYFQGNNVVRNTVKGVRLLEKCGKFKDPDLTPEQNEHRNSTGDSAKQRIDALVELWGIYASKNVPDIPQDFDKSHIRLNEAAATENNFPKHDVKKGKNLRQTLANAQEILSHTHKLGVLGAPKNDIKARYWNEKAKENGMYSHESIKALITVHEKLQEEYEEVPSKCSNCMKVDVANNFFKCARCLMPDVLYCDKTCQRQNWSTHKQRCKAYKTANTTG